MNQNIYILRKVYKNNKTLIIKEFSIKDDKNPYYPINNSLNREKYRKYKELANKIKSFYVGGRLADYAYYRYGYDDFCSSKKI